MNNSTREVKERDLNECDVLLSQWDWLDVRRIYVTDCSLNKRQLSFTKEHGGIENEKSGSISDKEK